MSDQEVYYYLNESRARITARRWWPKTIAICAIIGGIYGAAIGSAINTTDGAARVIGVAAAVMALIFGIPLARYGFLFGMVNRIPFGRLFVRAVAAIGGAIFGGFLGIIAVMPLGAILGALGGWFFTRAISQRGFLRILLGRVSGIVLGACLGATLLAFLRDQTAALVGIAWGMGIGGVVGLLLLHWFIKIMNSLSRWR